MLRMRTCVLLKYTSKAGRATRKTLKFVGRGSFLSCIFTPLEIEFDDVTSLVKAITRNSTCRIDKNGLNDSILVARTISCTLIAETFIPFHSFSLSLFHFLFFFLFSFSLFSRLLFPSYVRHCFSLLIESSCTLDC